MGKQGRRARWSSWSDEELGFIMAAHEGRPPGSVSLKELAKELGRPYDDVKARCTLLGLRRVGGCMVDKDGDEAYMLRVRLELES